MSQHLSQTEFTEALHNTLSPARTPHLTSCAVCREELQAFRIRTRELRDALICWSVRPAAMRRRKLLYISRRQLGSFLSGLAMAACVVVLALLPAGAGHRHATTASLQKTVTPAQAQIARDNQLLKTVDGDISEEVAPAMQPLLLTGSKQAQVAAQQKEIAQ